MILLRRLGAEETGERVSGHAAVPAHARWRWVEGHTILVDEDGVSGHGDGWIPQVIPGRYDRVGVDEAREPREGFPKVALDAQEHETLRRVRCLLEGPDHLPFGSECSALDFNGAAYKEPLLST